MDIEIDLDDGLPPSRAEATTKAARVSEAKPLRFAAPPVTFVVTATPVALVVSVAAVECKGCGAVHSDHRGLFVENKLSNGVTRFDRVQLRGMDERFVNLTRKLDVPPREFTPFCVMCFTDPAVFEKAVAAEKPIEPAKAVCQRCNDAGEVEWQQIVGPEVVDEGMMPCPVCTPKKEMPQ